MTTALIVYLLGLVPAFYLYRAWVGAIDRNAFPELPSPAAVLNGVSLFGAGFWPCAWAGLILGCWSAQVDPFCQKPRGEM